MTPRNLPARWIPSKVLRFGGSPRVEPGATCRTFRRCPPSGVPPILPLPMADSTSLEQFDDSLPQKNCAVAPQHFLGLDAF
jgi:hypothetical protein